MSEAILTAVEYIKFSEQCRKYFHPSINDLTQMQTTINQFETNVNDSPELSPERIGKSVRGFHSNDQSSSIDNHGNVEELSNTNSIGFILDDST